MKRTRVQALMVSGGLIVSGGLAGCSPMAARSGTAVGAAAAPNSGDCTTAPATAPTVAAVVMDDTASGDLRSIPGAVAEALQSARLGVRPSDSAAVLMVGVNGTSAKPRELPRIDLNPQPTDSRAGDDARAAVTACVLGRLTDPQLAPTVAGTDLLAALARAARSGARSIIVSSDGVPSAPPLQLNGLNLDENPTSLVNRLAKQHQFPSLAGIKVTWAGLGNTRTPLAEPTRTALQALWQEVLTGTGATVTFAPDSGGTVVNTSVPRSVLADPVSPPRPQLSTAGQAQCASVPGALLFTPDTSTLADPAAAGRVLEPIVTALRAHPTWEVLVTGHTAHFGSESGRLALSKARAKRVVDLLVSTGLANHLWYRGAGSTLPALPETDLAAAAKNRRVEIVYGPPSAVFYGIRCR